jgi:hypothetical protein
MSKETIVDAIIDNAEEADLGCSWKKQRIVELLSRKSL